MNQFNNQVASRPEMDLGLRSFMLGTYRWMAMAMGVTAVVAYFVSNFIATSAAARQFLFGNAIVSLAFLGIVMFGFSAVGRKLATMSIGGVLIALFGFAAFLGVIAAPIALVFDPVSITKVFLMAVAMFGGLSLFGYSTNSDLSGVARIAGMAFLAFVAISFLGMFFPALRPSGTGEILFLVVGLGAISVLTASQTQDLKRMYYQVAGHGEMAQKMSAFGAASLLLAFYNIFVILLQLFGNRN